MKPIRLTQSEIDNAQQTSTGKSYTVIVRPQAKGGYFVAMVDVETGLPIERYGMREVDNKSQVSDAVRDINRMMDKMGHRIDGEPGMFDKSRHRDVVKSSQNVKVAQELMKIAKSLTATSVKRIIVLRGGYASFDLTMENSGGRFPDVAYLAKKTATLTNEAIEELGKVNGVSDFEKAEERDVYLYGEGNELRFEVRRDFMVDLDGKAELKKVASKMGIQVREN